MKTKICVVCGTTIQHSNGGMLPRGWYHMRAYGPTTPSGRRTAADKRDEAEWRAALAKAGPHEARPK